MCMSILYHIFNIIEEIKRIQTDVHFRLYTLIIESGKAKSRIYTFYTSFRRRRLKKKGAGVSRSLKDNDITPLLDYLK